MEIILIFQLIVLLFSVVIHEVSHGLVALWFGDPTAKYQGRLTLNPIKHLDPIGTVALPLMLLFLSGGQRIFGWAKPVPYNPYNLRYRRWGPALVGLAGPASNILLALFFGILVRLGDFGILKSFVPFEAIVVLVNLSLAMLNLIPIPPLDGSKLVLYLAPSHLAERLEFVFERWGLLLILLIFMFPGALWALLGPPVEFLFRLFTGI